jgi:hypothetical protein
MMYITVTQAHQKTIINIVYFVIKVGGQNAN